MGEGRKEKQKLIIIKKKSLKQSLTKSLLLRSPEFGIAQKVTGKAPAEAYRQVNVPKIKYEPVITGSYK